MKDIFFKLKVLFISTVDNFKAWKEFVWYVELDNLYCCDGRECGCMATTNRDQIKHQYQVDIKPISTSTFHDNF